MDPPDDGGVPLLSDSDPEPLTPTPLDRLDTLEELRELLMRDLRRTHARNAM